MKNRKNNFKYLILKINSKNNYLTRNNLKKENKKTIWKKTMPQ